MWGAVYNLFLAASNSDSRTLLPTTSGSPEGVLPAHSVFQIAATVLPVLCILMHQETEFNSSSS